MAAKIYRFGLFELNTTARQLHKQGRRIRVQEQPLRLLEILLEEPGRLVTRAELRQRLWPGDIHVDFELGLTGAIKRLRFALGDSGENPRFIETVPKSGYRFIAPVQTFEPHQSNSPQTGVFAAAAQPAWEGPAPGSSSTERRQSSHVVIVGLIAALVAISIFLRPQPPMPQVVRIVQLSNSGKAWPQESLLFDGARVYYTEFSAEHGFRLRQILLNGNEDTPVAGLTPNLLVRSFSPDRTMFVAISGSDARDNTPSPLWLVPLTGGPERRMGNVKTNDFAWSPDGSSMAFARDGQIFIADAAGDHSRAITSVPGNPFLPRWSPDGAWLRFTVEDARSALSIWEVRPDGRDLRPLHFGLPGSPMDGFGEWAADGRFYVFASRRDQLSNLWIAEERHRWWQRARHEAVQLTAGPLNYFRPLPASDGRRIFALGTRSTGELMRYDPVRRTFVQFMDGRSADHLEFSRDGRWVAYVAFPEGTLWRARSDGTEALQLTFAPLRVTLPRWSPDGKRIAFTADKPGEVARVYTISPDGGSPAPLPAEPLPQADASWTPAGDLIYGRDRDHPEGALLLRYDSRNGKTEKLSGSEGLVAPLCSPDGRYIVAYTTSVESSLTLLDLHSGKRTALTQHRAIYPAWSADSKYLYFNTMMHEKPSIYRVRISDGREEKIADVPFEAVGIYGSWSGLASDGSVILLRNRSQTDVYELILSER